MAKAPRAAEWNLEALNEIHASLEQLIVGNVLSNPSPQYYREARWRWTSRYSCQINPITMTSKTVKTMRPNPCVYEKR